ncbi:MAG: ORF6N domain-containing protein [Candidatus Acidiferrum sp.]
MPTQNAIVPTALITQKILFLRHTRVMLDADLAQLYGVATKNLNKAVKRNASRFPSDFTFQLSPRELQTLGFQTGTSKPGRGGRRYSPYVFTEQGVAMLSSVLRSSRAVQVNVAIMRTFVRLREMLATHEELRRHSSHAGNTHSSENTDRISRKSGVSPEACPFCKGKSK